MAVNNTMPGARHAIATPLNLFRTNGHVPGRNISSFTPTTQAEPTREPTPCQVVRVEQLSRSKLRASIALLRKNSKTGLRRIRRTAPDEPVKPALSSGMPTNFEWRNPCIANIPTAGRITRTQTDACCQSEDASASHDVNLRTDRLRSADGDPAAGRAPDLRLFIRFGGRMESPDRRNLRPQALGVVATAHAVGGS